jgi:hypothetical protein
MSRVHWNTGRWIKSTNPEIPSEHCVFTVLLRSLGCLARHGLRWIVFRNSSEKNWLIGDYLISISRHPSCKPYNILGRLRFGGTYCLHHQVRRISWTRNQEGEGAKRTSACPLAYSSTLMMDTMLSFNTLVSVCQIIERFNPETSTHPTYHFENAKCNKTLLLFTVLQPTAFCLHFLLFTVSII